MQLFSVMINVEKDKNELCDAITKLHTLNQDMLKTYIINKYIYTGSELYI